ncbi:MAG: dinitrogenase iron-molybdenum cofactor biosynthesis protein [Candidatus Lokiarchaeota archaeon]|nr:dinitrogenase iron-molybdenum cofactor biosynthesis protein [Candidatus Lokiarchaeota archaeon]
MTKVCVTASDDNLQSPIDPRFGRCTYFIIVDTDSMDVNAVKNRAASATGGAGIQAAQTVASKGAEVVITGAVGPNAHSALQSSGIRILTGASGTVNDAIEAFKGDELTEIQSPGPAHRGLGAGRRRGGGGGRGGRGR